MKHIRQLFWAILVVAQLTACASKQALTEQEVLNTYEDLGALQQQLDVARQNEVYILSPNEFQQAANQYEQAYRAAMAGDESATRIAKQGLTHLQTANKNAELARDVFEDLLVQRSKAVSANEGVVAGDKLLDAEKELLKLTTLLEEQKTAEAKAGREDLIRTYAEIELAALKTSILATVNNELASQEREGIDDVTWFLLT